MRRLGWWSGVALLLLLLLTLCGGWMVRRAWLRHAAKEPHAALHGIAVDADTAEAHATVPHQEWIHLLGQFEGSHQIHVHLQVAEDGHVVAADAEPSTEADTYWWRVRGDVMRWRFRPFEQEGRAVPASVDEYVNILPNEQWAMIPARAPDVRDDSEIVIELSRTGCFGSCPGYDVRLDRTGVLFDGRWQTAVKGKHRASYRTLSWSHWRAGLLRRVSMR